MKYEGWRVGKTIRDLREKKNMTLAQFSYELDASQSHVTQIELGHHGMSIDLFCKIMDVLTVDANTLLNIEKKPCEENHISIDKQLYDLPEKKKNYLMNVFQHMIDNLSGMDEL